MNTHSRYAGVSPGTVIHRNDHERDAPCPPWLQLVVGFFLVAATTVTGGVSLAALPLVISIMRGGRVLGTLLWTLTVVGWPIALLWAFMP